MINKIKAYDKFDEYIKKSSPTKGIFYGQTDSSEGCILEIVKEKDTISYKGVPHLGFGQPFKYENKYLIDLRINILLLDILPKKSHTNDFFTFKQITEKYIYWYLNNL